MCLLAWHALRGNIHAESGAMCGSESGNNAIAPTFKALDHFGAWQPLQLRMAVFVETLTRNGPQVEKLFLFRFAHFLERWEIVAC